MRARWHLRDLRLYVNAGLRMPACKAGARLLDMDATRWNTVSKASAVTCKRCRQLLRAKGVA